MREGYEITLEAVSNLLRNNFHNRLLTVSQMHLCISRIIFALVKLYLKVTQYVFHIGVFYFRSRSEIRHGE